MRGVGWGGVGQLRNVSENILKQVKVTVLSKGGVGTEGVSTLAPLSKILIVHLQSSHITGCSIKH